MKRQPEHRAEISLHIPSAQLPLESQATCVQGLEGTTGDRHCPDFHWHRTGGINRFLLEEAALFQFCKLSSESGTQWLQLRTNPSELRLHRLTNTSTRRIIDRWTELGCLSSSRLCGQEASPS